MVCRISSDANLDNPHHQDGEDSIFREPREQRPHHDNDHHLRDRDRATIHLGGLSARFTPLPALYWPLVTAMLLTYAILTHVVKVWFIRRWGL